MKSIIEKSYKFVLLESVNELIASEAVKNLLPQIIDFKQKGYSFEYPGSVLPFDSSDFIASHLLLCEYKEDSAALKPVLGFKSVTLEQCNKHRITFPMLEMLKSPDNTGNCHLAINGILDKYNKEGNSNKIAYNGSFTICPSIRKNKELMKYIWELSFSLLENYYIEKDISHVLAVCATRFNIHKKKETHGWNYIISNGEVLKSYRSHSLFEEDLIPMELVNPKSKGFVHDSIFKNMWKDRIILNKESLK